DTGIDYTHANFGGPGTVDAFNAAAAASTQPANPALFGPNAPKVKGGTDLVGDAYDAGGTGDALVPHPDPNPLDCAAHGSHVAGTIAGFGVLADGTTYHGSYDQQTHATHNFMIGPGVAPKADLYAVRVFGCSGSTNVIAEALEWAVDNDMDVVNMSLGSDFAPANSADSVATDAAMRAGLMVVSAAGNADTTNLYITGSPGNSSKGMGIAASLNPATIPMASLSVPAAAKDGARVITAQDSNGVSFTNGTTMTLFVLKNGNETVGFGCDASEYNGKDV